ncbi:MAG: hypothetical protein FJ150_04325 [Euryarchaeota archaeon]|nr:hypothetical protein [Euryarchaeota archaeon]
MSKGAIVIIIFFLLGGYFYFSTALGNFDPVGRLGFVKLENPDMYPGNTHSKVLAQYARDRGSNTALVVHFAGDADYRHYKEGDVLIIELAFIDKKGSTVDIDWNEVITYGLMGVPDDRWKFRADGKEFDTLDEALDYVNSLAKRNGQQGPIPMVYHGTTSGGNPIISQGCGFPLYFQIVRKQYGILAAYYYVLKGMIFPFISLPTKNYELQHAAELQYYYHQHILDNRD